LLTPADVHGGRRRPACSGTGCGPGGRSPRSSRTLRSRPSAATSATSRGLDQQTSTSGKERSRIA
jgi:hypothetical protein